MEVDGKPRATGAPSLAGARSAEVAREPMRMPAQRRDRVDPSLVPGSCSLVGRAERCWACATIARGGPRTTLSERVLAGLVASLRCDGEGVVGRWATFEAAVGVPYRPPSRRVQGMPRSRKSVAGYRRELKHFPNASRVSERPVRPQRRDLSQYSRHSAMRPVSSSVIQIT